ncbi:MAG: VanW family protein [Anaerocolumna sp.]
MRKKQHFVQVILVITFCLFSVLMNPKTAWAAEDDVITKGVYIDSVDISGMTKEEATKAVEEHFNELKEKEVTVKVEGNEESVKVGDLGYSYKENTYVEEALQIGKTGNLIKRYKELKDTEEGKVVYHLEKSLEDALIKSFVEEKLAAYNVEVINATVSRKDGGFVYTDEVVGMKVNTNKTLELIKSNLLENWNEENVKLEASIETEEPKYTREMVEKCNALLGTYYTTYATSSSNRAGNLANGAKLIHNTVLYPGDVFSAYEKLTPFTTANGYYEAGSYSNGMLVDSIGGGACQVTTTLYNAILLAELEVVERAAHSMTISYVDLSRDSAIAGTWKDLKFENNTEAPVIVEAYTQGRTITFNIWGNETRDTKNRKVEYKTVVISQKEPGKDVITEDPNQLVGYEVVTQSSHTGYVAELYKIVYENGEKVSEERVNKSVYNASPKYITVGTKVEEPEVEETDEDTDGKENGKEDEKEDEKEDINTKPENKPSEKPSSNNNANSEELDGESDSESQNIEDFIFNE